MPFELDARLIIFAQLSRQRTAKRCLVIRKKLGFVTSIEGHRRKHADSYAKPR